MGYSLHSLLRTFRRLDKAGMNFLDIAHWYLQANSGMNGDDQMYKTQSLTSKPIHSKL